MVAAKQDGVSGVCAAQFVLGHFADPVPKLRVENQKAAVARATVENNGFIVFQNQQRW